jgi:23S rRNA pseudouridine2605 synthase
VTADDKVTVDGKLLPKRERTRLWLYHKPRGLVTTEKDPEGRPTVFENLDPSLPRVMSIGRLDINTEGLLLLTNDGGLARQLELPKTGWLRRYRVRAFGETDQAQLDKLFEGLTIDGVDYGRIEARLDKEQGANAWLTLGLREGKNREVKNVLGSIGLDVNRLIRVSYGPFQLGELAEGTVEEVKTRVLIDQLGPDLIAEAECEFEAPVYERGEEMATKPASGKPAPGRPGKDGPRRGLRVKAEDGAHERVMRGGLIEDRHGRRVLVQRVADVPEDKPAKRAKPYRDRGGEFSFKPRPSFKDRDSDGGGERPRPSFRDRDSGGGDRPFKPRPSFRDRDEGGERARPSIRDRNEGGGERPFKPRPSFRDRDEGGDRPRSSSRDRDGGGDRPFKPRPPSFRERNEGGSDRPFKPRRFEDRAEGGERPFKPRFGGKPGGEKFGGGKPFGASKGPPRGRPGGHPGGRPGGRPPGGRPPGRGPRRDD